MSQLKSSNDLKTERTWTALTVMNDVKVRLEKLKEEKEKKFKTKLSWSKFFSFLLTDLGK